MDDRYQTILFGVSILGVLPICLGLLINFTSLEIVTSILQGIRITIIISLLMAIGYGYHKSRNSVLIFLLLSLLFFLFSEILEEIIVLPAIEVQVIIFVFNLAIPMVLLLGSLYFFWLFIESFDLDIVFTPKNTFLLFAVTTISTGIVTSMYHLLGLIEGVLENMGGDIPDRPDQPEGLMPSQLPETPLFEGNAAELLGPPELVLLDTLELLLIISVIVTGVLIFLILRSLTVTIRNMQNDKVRLTLKYIRLGSIAMMVGPIVPVIISQLFQGEQEIFLIADFSSTIFSITGLVTVICYYQKIGFFALQNETLRRLLIINPAGVPVYSYYFRAFKEGQESTIDDTMSEEVLFSGAVSSISMLLQELTGSANTVREIKLEQVHLMVNTVDDYSLILMMDTPTQFFRSALDLFSNGIKDLINKDNLFQVFSTTQMKVANGLVEQNFGFGYYQQIGNS